MPQGPLSGAPGTPIRCPRDPYQVPVARPLSYGVAPGNPISWPRCPRDPYQVPLARPLSYGVAPGNPISWLRCPRESYQLAPLPQGPLEGPVYRGSSRSVPASFPRLSVTKAVFPQCSRQLPPKPLVWGRRRYNFSLKTERLDQNPVAAVAVVVAECRCRRCGCRCWLPLPPLRLPCICLCICICICRQAPSEAGGPKT